MVDGTKNRKSLNSHSHILLALVAILGLSYLILIPAHGISCPSSGCIQYGNSVNNMAGVMHTYQSTVHYTGITNTSNHTQTFTGAFPAKSGYNSGLNSTVSNPNNSTRNAYTQQGYNNTTSNSGGYKTIPNAPSSKYSLQVSVTTDKTSYNYGDLIMVSGHVNPVIEGASLNIVMKGQNSEIQAGQAQIRSDGSFSEQVYAGGPQWTNAGYYYTITAQYGSYTYSGTTFYFSKAPVSSTPDPTSTTITPNSATVSTGSSITLSAQISDTSHLNNRFSSFGFHALPLATTGTVSWSDNGAGGTFDPASCTLSSGSCMTSYAPSMTPPSTITITASYEGDTTYGTSSGTASLTTSAANQINPTSTTITPNSATVSAGGSITFSAQIIDTSRSPTTTTGTVSWSDNGAGGTFDPASCTLSSGSCMTSYITSASPPSTITITASYSGDTAHSTSGTSASLATKSTLDTTAINVTSSPATFTSGSANTLTASITDTSNPSSSMIGIVSWSDNGAGGTFSPDACTLSDNQCALTYTPPSTLPSSITITATYGGDSGHSGSSGMTSLSSASGGSALTVTTDKPSYSAGNNVTITIYSPNVSSGENVAILVTDPSSNIIASRTIQFNAQGYAELLVGLLSNAQAGTYQISASASSNGSYMSGSATFTTTSSLSTSATSSGVTIVSVQPTDQMGDSVVTSYGRGTTGFAKVVISSTSSQSALITVNLVGSDGTSLGVGSVKTSLGAGSSELIVSFYVPSGAAVGTANIYADIFSDWPSNGGIPLTAEASSTVSIQ